MSARTLLLAIWLVWLCKHADESYVEDDLLCLLNTGEVCVFTVPSLRRQIAATVIGRDNVMSVFHDFCHRFCVYISASGALGIRKSVQHVKTE